MNTDWTDQTGLHALTDLCSSVQSVANVLVVAVRRNGSFPFPTRVVRN